MLQVNDNHSQLPCADIFKGQRVLVVGLGKTGMSCIRFLVERGVDVAVTDTRDNPTELATLKAQFPDVAVFIGGLNEEAIRSADVLLVSPGVSVQTPAIAEAFAGQKPVIGDIEVFAQCTHKPVVAITGSNGKSTVTTLLGEMAKVAKNKVNVAGNIGLPVLDTINTDANTELYVLELSSFQLETTYSLNAAASVILNITEDHMDRYRTMADYTAAKARIAQGTGAVIINKDEANVCELAEVLDKNRTRYTYATQLSASEVDFGVVFHNNENWLAKHGKPLIPVSALKIKGNHNVSNVLASLALGTAVNLPMPAMLEAAQQFTGLPHRTQWVTEHNGVVWFNDSKATNVGATAAAVKGLSDYKLILLMGGQGKGQDFSELRQIFRGIVKHVYLFGEDAKRIGDALGEPIAHSYVKDMQQAISEANQMAGAGDAVLLSPACASFDMFNGYDHRGREFMRMVQEVIA